MAEPKTIQVYREGIEDPIRINEEDFNSKTDERIEERATKLKGRLPKEFPGFKELDEAGIHTYAQIRKARKDGDKIPGIADGIGAQIDQALAVVPAEE